MTDHEQVLEDVVQDEVVLGDDDCWETSYHVNEAWMKEVVVHGG